jgi:biotin-dependent carboxylase-like uncharacterized protein
MRAALRVIAPGLMTTLQDLGRFGYQHMGIPVSGALDGIGLRAANLIAGNPADMAALEIAYQGPTLAVEAESVRIALAGGTAPIEILPDGNGSGARRIPCQQSVRLERGQIFRVGAWTGSAVLYLAVAGGFDVAPVLGSRSTYARAAIGGFQGRVVEAGDLLPLHLSEAAQRDEQMLASLDLAAPARFRVVLGPQDDHFTQAGLRTLLESTYTVSPASDRMGMRLNGPPLQHAAGFDIVSDGIAPGAIQVPGNGLPIILLADRQSTGGYPKPATVISADIPALGRLTPGARVAFEAVTIEAAEAARRQMAAMIAGLAAQLMVVPRKPVVDEAALMHANLVSGVVNARERFAP